MSEKPWNIKIFIYMDIENIMAARKYEYQKENYSII